MTLSSKVSALTGPDRAVDALEKLERRARSERRWWTTLGAICILMSLIFSDDLSKYAAVITGAVFLVGSGLAHLFALLSAALAARGL